ncbi:hypothetical protein P171DRAFT_489907 [Karstenula rhodostoma CBS 690.94]|uniref:DUF6604 domain-containing protein n=1 Tax=Karstenula rhodostoma CBS 690.94 TaxID=1392251 RepID=A0A9P4PA43_9PLEO|nr:hypothetical protein P171DRAFT_489907 [Karstenula rhodostoma CBS 690.94]
MASESLKSTYQQYKRDTEVVASWRANTAREHGYDNPLGVDGSIPAPVKPKAQKKGKECYAEQTKRVTSLRSETPHRSLNTSLLFKMRRLRYLSGLTSSLKELFEYFVDVLGQVKKTLQSLVPEWTGVPGKSSVKSTPADESSRTIPSLQNLFQALAVYEPSAAFEAAPDVERPAPMETVFSVEQDSLFGALFALTTLMGDLSRLIEEIVQLWREYGRPGQHHRRISSHRYCD